MKTLTLAALAAMIGFSASAMTQSFDLAQGVLDRHGFEEVSAESLTDHQRVQLAFVDEGTNRTPSETRAAIISVLKN